MKSVDDIIFDYELRRDMLQASALRLTNDKGWAMKWRHVSARVGEASKKALQWLSPFGVTGVEIQDGFVVGITLPADAFVRNTYTLDTLVPRLKYVTLTQMSANPLLTLVCEDPLMSRVRALSLTNNNLCDESIEILAKSFRLVHLCWLDISDNQITNQGLEILASSKVFDRLAYVAIHGNPCDDPLELSVRDWGQTMTDLQMTDFGRRLEALSPFGHLAWIHAQVKYDNLYPPLMCDAEKFTTLQELRAI